MLQHIARATGAAMLTVALFAGCQSDPATRPYADNPLLMSRQPLVIPPPTAYAASRRDPRAPVPMTLPTTPPATMVAQQPSAEKPEPPAVAAAAAAGGPVLPATTSAAPVPPEPPPPAAAPPPAPLPTQATTSAPLHDDVPGPPPSAVRLVSGKYGHTSDYSWLQGEIDRTYRGSLDLRYCPASEEDTWGGKVRLADDPRLAEFRPGDVVSVEGEVVKDSASEGHGWDQYPRFVIRDVKLVERAVTK